MPQEILYSKTDNWTFLQSDSKYVTFFFAAASAFFFSAQLVFSFPQCKIILIGNSCLEYICNVWIIQRNWFISTIIGVNLIHFNMHKINLQPTSWSASQNWTKPKWSFSKTSHCSSKVEIEILLMSKSSRCWWVAMSDIGKLLSSKALHFSLEILYSKFLSKSDWFTQVYMWQKLLSHCLIKTNLQVEPLEYVPRKSTDLPKTSSRLLRSFQIVGVRSWLTALVSLIMLSLTFSSSLLSW